MVEVSTSAIPSKRVFDLVHVVGVPARHDVGALVEERPRPGRRPVAHVDETGVGRAGADLGRTRRDGHGRKCNRRAMSTPAHDDSASADHNAVVRDSFTQQVGLFTGDNSPFARRIRLAARRGSSPSSPT